MSTPDHREEKHLEELEPETVEDLGVDDDEDVRGGSLACVTF